MIDKDVSNAIDEVMSKIVLKVKRDYRGDKFNAMTPKIFLSRMLRFYDSVCDNDDLVEDVLIYLMFTDLASNIESILDSMDETEYTEH